MKKIENCTFVYGYTMVALLKKTVKTYSNPVNISRYSEKKFLKRVNFWREGFCVYFFEKVHRK
jgi:hypothetical protein